MAKDKMIGYIIYNNVAHPYVRFVGCLNEEVAVDEIYRFEDNEIENGMPVSNDKMVEFITINTEGYKNIIFLLNINESFSATFGYPKLDYFNEQRLYNEELKNNFPDYKAKFKLKTHKYSNKLETYFYNHFMPIKYLNFATKIVRSASIKTTNIIGYDEFIYSKMTKLGKTNFAYLYDNFGVVTLVMSIGKAMITGVSFESNPTEITKHAFAYIDKHQYETEKEEFTILTNSDSIIEKLETGTKEPLFKE